MIDERLMAPGSWELRLKPDTPLRVRARLCASFYNAFVGDMVVVTPTRLPVSGLSWSTLLSKSIYTGLILRSELTNPGQPATIGGANLLWWLGDTSRDPNANRGAFPGALTTFPLLLLNLFSGPTNGIAYSDVGVPTTVINFSWSDSDTLWTILERWRKATNPETQFRLRHDGTVLFAALTDVDLFVQTPTLLLSTTGPFSRSGGVRTVKVDDVSVSWDYTAWSGSVDVICTPPGGRSTGYPTYDPFGINNLGVSPKLTTPPGTAPNFAALVSEVRTPEINPPSYEPFTGYAQRVEVKVRGVNDLRFGVDCNVGDAVMVQDAIVTGSFPDAALTTARVHGSEQQVLKARIASARWPVTSDMGVYLASPWGTYASRGFIDEDYFTVTDIAEYVDFEDGRPAEVTLGSVPTRVNTPAPYRANEV